MSAVARSAGPRHVALAAAALAAGVAGFVLVNGSDHFPDRELWALFGPIVGWSWVGAGLYARERRPESRLGSLMTALGFAWFLTPLSAADSPLLFTAGFVLGSVWGPLLAHLLLSFPSGRLPSGPQRALIAAGYVLAPLLPVPAMLVLESAELTECEGPCPENLLLVSHDADLGETLLAAGSAVLMTLCLLVVGLLVARWRRAGQSERRSLAPLLGAGGVTLLFVFGFAATQAQALITLAFLAFAATPLAFLAGLLRADFSQARGVRSLVARLAELPAPGDLRDALAGALGDTTLSVAYWVPEQRRYVDGAGAAVELPAADDSDRAVTEIERDGRRIAAIVHDHALVDDRETVRAAGAATALLLENQRLDAELRARMEDLRASRQRLVQAGDAERRRLERDLHDGAQSRLVALALNLRLARGSMEGESETAALLDASIDELKLSLAELRELAHGIHPAVLSERGLEPAVRSLAARAPVPVALEGSLGGRLPAAVETAAYFVVSEGLANVAKYAQAAHATVRMQRTNGRLLLEVSDDGIGGAAASAGSGLHGLSDRVAALDGTLEVASPPGGGTCLRVELPLLVSVLRVVVAEDSFLLRSGVVRVLEATGFDVVGEAADRVELLEQVHEHRPDVVVTDIRMPPTQTDEGLRAAAEIRAELPGTGVLVLSQFANERYALQLLGESAAGLGYLLKDRVMEPQGFADAVREVARGGSALDPDVVARMLDRRRPGGPIDTLTDRERDVLAGMAEGRSNRAIAADLGLTEHTLERDLTRIFDKLELPVDSEGHRRVLAVLTYLRAQ